MPLPPSQLPIHPSLPSRPGRPTVARSNASVGPIPTGKIKEEGEIQEDDGQDIPEFGVPAWRTVLNRRQDLGYPDFYPSRPGFNQPEDVLTEDNVKNGFSAKSFVVGGAESFSMHGPINTHLLGGCLNLLNKLGREVLEKRNEGMPHFGERTFRIPPRVTYNDSKRSQFLSELSNTSIPLHRQMRLPVPHAAKGIDFFETLYCPTLPPGHTRTPSGTPNPTQAATTPKPIQLDRAVWCIRVLGSNEIQAHRGRAQGPIQSSVASPAGAATPSSNNTGVGSGAPVLPVNSSDWYTVEFTGLFCSWLRAQLGQMVLPSTKAKPCSAILGSKPGTGVLGDEKGRARWLGKWKYSIDLLRELHTQYLISSRVLVGWLVDTIATANFAQLGFAASILGDYMPEMGRHVTIARQCFRAVCAKLEEISASPAASTMGKIQSMLESIVSALYVTNPECLLSPALWQSHSTRLKPLLNLNSYSPQLDAIERRSCALIFHPATSETSSSPRRQQMEDLRKLDMMDANTDMLTLCKTFFDGPSSPTSTSLDISRFEEKVSVLLDWSMGLFHLGIHHGYAVHTLLKHWQEQRETMTNGKSFEMFPLLYKWMDTSDSARKESNALAVGVVFGELIRQGIFSYGKYLQAIISHGHSARSHLPGSEPSHHLGLLRAIPIFVQAKDLLHQRRIALCGNDLERRRRDEMEEHRRLSAFKEDVMEYIPEVFGWKRYGKSAVYREAVDYKIPSTNGLTRYLFLQARFWLIPAAVEHLVRQGKKPTMDDSTFARVLHVFKLSSGFSTIADFLIRALRVTEDDAILDVVVDTIRRDAVVWTAMDKWRCLTDALIERMQVEEEKGKYHAGFMGLLMELREQGRLRDDDRADVKTVFIKHTDTVRNDTPGTANPKDSMLAVHQCISGGHASDAIGLADALFDRLGSFKSWAGMWWSTVVIAIQRSDSATAKEVTMAALAHIERIDDKSHGMLDALVTAWLDSLPITASMELMGLTTSPLFTSILLHLCARRRLRNMNKVFEKLVYPTWETLGLAVMTSKTRLSAKQLYQAESTLNMTTQVLLTSTTSKFLPPSSLRESLVLQTECIKIFASTNVTALIQHLPFLVLLRIVKQTPEKIKKQISSLVEGLASMPEFKAASFRHMEVLKNAFLSNEWSRAGLDPDIEAGMIDVLKLIMSQESPGSTKDMSSISSLDSSSRFSAWRWTSVVLSMGVEFKRLAMRIDSGGNDGVDARKSLHDLVHATLDRECTADDTDLLCEAFRGMESVIAQEILAVGLERLSGVLSRVIGSDTQDQLESLSVGIDLLLRVLHNASPGSPITSTAGILTAHNALLDLLSVSLQAVERPLSGDATSPLLSGDMRPVQPGMVISILMRVLRFALGLKLESGPLTVARPDYGRLAVSYLRVLATIKSDIEPATAQVMTDMLIYIIDSAPALSRSAIHTALLAESTTSMIQGALKGLQSPSIARALPYTSPPRRPMVLTGSNIPDDGIHDPSIPLDDRPWELFENLTPAPPVLKRSEQFLATRPMNDTASISISMFAPKFKRDTLPIATSQAEADEREWDAYIAERNLGDGLAGEPILAKRLVTGLYEVDVKEQAEGGDGNNTKSEDASPATVPLDLRNRPRRSSTRIATASSKATATGTGTGAGTAKEGSNMNPITIDLDDSPVTNDDDDEDESDEDEKVRHKDKRARVGGKVPAKSARKTYGGKAPSKSTVGVARKTTGGKSLGRKGVASKATRGGKR